MRTAAKDGKESSTTVQGDVTDITDQPMIRRQILQKRNEGINLGDEQTTERKKGSLYEGLLKQSLDSYKDDRKSTFRGQNY